MKTLLSGEGRNVEVGDKLLANGLAKGLTETEIADLVLDARADEIADRQAYREASQDEKDAHDNL